MVTHVLAEIFTSLYKGFGCTVEYQEDDGDKTQDATGTGVGEGAGAKDVSEQIEDEDHLLGTEKGEKQDVFNDNVPSIDENGIEMEQDYNVDALDVSEDENKDETKEPKLDSAMGETWEDSETVDEKLWDNKDDENDENSDNDEKYNWTIS